MEVVEKKTFFSGLSHDFFNFSVFMRIPFFNRWTSAISFFTFFVWYFSMN